MLRFIVRRPTQSAEEGPPEKRARPDEPPALLSTWYARAIATLQSFQQGRARTGKVFIETCIKQANDAEELTVLARFAEDFKPGAKVTKPMPTQEAIAPVENKIPKTILAAVHKRHLELDCQPASVAAPHLLQQLSEVFHANAEDIKRVRSTRHGIFSLVDVTSLISKVAGEHAAIQINRTRKQYPEVFTKCKDFKFPGGGQRLTPAGDIYMCVELIMVLPGKRAGLIRSKAARLLVEYYGGSLEMASQIIENREHQDVMAVEEPEHPLRAMGQAVEQEHGSTNEQLAGLREKMSRSIPAIKSQRYDATKFTEAHNKHKNLMNTRFLALIGKVHANPADLPGFLAILDDFDEKGTLRTTEALITDLGVPANKIISPNRNPEVVDALKAKGVCAEVGDFKKVMFQHFHYHQIAAAYLDLTSGDPAVMFAAIGTVEALSMFNSVGLATTMVERGFTRGGTEPFTKRVLHLTERLQSLGYEPDDWTLAESYFEIVSGSQRVATQFWRKMQPHYPRGRPGGGRIYSLKSEPDLAA